MANILASIPTIDMSSIFKEGDEGGKKMLMGEIGKASTDFGCFQIINHGFPVKLINQARELTKTFFDYPVEEKLKCKPHSTILPSGYGRMDNFLGCNEWMRVSQPELGFNIFPQSPPQLREILDEVYKEVQKLGSMVESMINEYLGLPVDFLKIYNDDRSKDILVAWHYPPTNAANNNKIGRIEHHDIDMITFLFQDDVGGLEFKIDGKWIPVVPVADAIVVNIGAILQVITNQRMVAARHRVVLKNVERSRQSFVYFYNIGSDKWIEPLSQFTHEIGEAPKYRGFIYNELLKERIKKETNPPTRIQDLADIHLYEIKTLAIDAKVCSSFSE